MKSSGKQTKIPFSERKLRIRNKCVTPKKTLPSSDDENSPLKYKLVVSSESKIILRRSSSSKSRRETRSSPEKIEQYRDRLRSTPKRLRNKSENEDCSSPSKQKYYGEDVSKTPEKGKSKSTPNTLLSRLQLSSGKRIIRPTVSDLKSEEYPNSNASSARKALFYSSNSLPCRGNEINFLLSVLEKHLQEQSCGSIYVSGLPGTGKTASIDYVIQDKKITKGFHIVKINCTCISSSGSIYKRICSELKLKTAGKIEKDPKVVVEKFLMRRHKMILLILDEIDQLETRSQSVLYKIFEWPSWKNAKLVLIGIANAMDLTDRILPRLCGKVELKPLLLHFSPYSKDEIKQILTHRLSEAGANNIFTPSAIELISAKVAGMSGDLRRALDLGRRVVELSEESKTIDARSANKSPDKKIGARGINADAIANLFKSGSENLNFDKSRETDVNCDWTDPGSIIGNPLNNMIDSVSQSNKILKPKNNLLDEENGEFVLKELKLNNFHELTNENTFSLSSPVKEKRTSSSPTNGKRIGISPVKTESKNRRESPRKKATISDCEASSKKIDFSVDSRDVMNVVKNIYGSSKNLKNDQDSSFPLHQKILIGTFLLISKKGKAKDLKIGRLHEVYTKVCTRRGITPVDLSGFIFLCRQVEMRGIMQIGKGPGKLAKISLQWDEAEVSDSLKDQNLLSSISDDVSCL